MGDPTSLVFSPSYTRWTFRNDKYSVRAKPIEWQRVGNQIDAALIFARAHFVNVDGIAQRLLGMIG
jgi:hypothetical protein